MSFCGSTSLENIFFSEHKFQGNKKATPSDTLSIPLKISRLVWLYGAGNVTWTRDLLITNQLLYRLSYTSIFNSKVLPANLNNGYDTTFFPHRQQKFMLPFSIHTTVVYITICIFAGILAFFCPAFFAFSTSFDRLFLSMTKNNKILLDRFLQKLYPFPKFQLFFWGLSAVLSLRNFL